MKLEVGKDYKSRDGRKWKCVHGFAEPKRGCDRFVCVCEEISTAYHFCDNGEYSGLYNTELDLISEWVEPVEHEVDVCFYKWGSSVTCLPSYLKFNGDGNEVLIAKFKVKFTEGDGL